MFQFNPLTTNSTCRHPNANCSMDAAPLDASHLFLFDCNGTQFCCLYDFFF